MMYYERSFDIITLLVKWLMIDELSGRYSRGTPSMVAEMTQV